MISSGGEGKVSAKKRLRGKIGNSYSAPELKTFNLMNADGANFAYSKEVLGVYQTDNNDRAGVWKPLKTVWPPLGTTSRSRIGKRIKVKYLRIKGYVAASPFLITQVRWRLVLYRTLKNLVNGVEVYNQAFLSSLYTSYRNPEDSGSSLHLQKSCCFNYYQSFFNQDAMKVRDCKRRVLVKGLLKPSADIGDYKIPANEGTTGYLRTVPNASSNTDSLALSSADITPSGSLNPDVLVWNNLSTITRNAQFITQANEIPIKGEFLFHNTVATMTDEVNAKAFFPIDVTVTMNDNIDVSEYTYIFVFEADWAVGQNSSGYFDNAAAYSNYKFEFIPQIYFTDD